MHPIIVITGPTASGKTSLAAVFARDLGGEVVSCDSMLIYKEPHVITAKPSSEALGQIPHHFINIVSVEDTYSAYQYCQQAREKIISLQQQNVPVIVCGGSGLYLKALLDGIFEGAGKDELLRNDLAARAQKEGKEALFKELERVDPQAARNLSANDLRRVIRALEVYYLTGVPFSEKKKDTRGLWGSVAIKIFGVRHSRAALYERINKRVDRMFEEGAIDEASALLGLQLSITAKKIIGIKEIEAHLRGRLSMEKTKELMKKNTRHFAKRQMTWFRNDSRVEWVDADTMSPEELKAEIIRKM